MGGATTGVKYDKNEVTTAVAEAKAEGEAMATAGVDEEGEDRREDDEGDRGADIGLPGRAGDTRALAGQRMERGGRSYPGGDRGERQAQTAGTSSGAVVGLTRGDSSGTVNASGGSNETGYRTQPE